MKKSELRQIIKEEIQKLNEDIQSDTKIIDDKKIKDEIKKAILKYSYTVRDVENINLKRKTFSIIFVDNSVKTLRFKDFKGAFSSISKTYNIKLWKLK